MYIVTFNIRSPMKFDSLDSAADFLCSVDYGFVACFDDKNNDISFLLCKLISKKLQNQHRENQLKKDFE